MLQYGEHAPNKFSALTLKHKNPSATIIMFSTGNITIMGPKTRWGAMYVLATLKRKFDLKIINVNVTNIVVKFTQLVGNNTRTNMDITALYNWNQKDCDCDIDYFQSCTYMVPGTKIKANFFNSKKVIVTGCKSEEMIGGVIKHLAYVMHKFYNDKASVGIVGNELVVKANP
jgi:TATA-box binding protein (TBP) (component of TFIID and TFIIIB)